MTAATSWLWYMTVSTGQHHLVVAGEGRHPVELVALEVLAGDDGQHAGDLQRLGGVDLQDLGVGVRAADDVEPQLAGQVDVVDVLARRHG